MYQLKNANDIKKTLFFIYFIGDDAILVPISAPPSRAECHKCHSLHNGKFFCVGRGGFRRAADQTKIRTARRTDFFFLIYKMKKRRAPIGYILHFPQGKYIARPLGVSRRMQCANGCIASYLFVYFHQKSCGYFKKIRKNIQKYANRGKKAT